MEDKQYYIIGFRSDEIISELEPKLKESGFKLEQVLQTVIPARKYLIEGPDDYVQSAVGYARSLEGILTIDKEKEYYILPGK
jgi:hypothetical protein